jgi:hypothetical protein
MPSIEYLPIIAWRIDGTQGWPIPIAAGGYFIELPSGRFAEGRTFDTIEECIEHIRQRTPPAAKPAPASAGLEAVE